MDFGLLALVVAAGLTGPVLASLGRFGPPVVVGQVAAGIVLGKTGLGWIDASDPLLIGLANIGFALLMFIVGTHLPVRDPALRASATRGAGLAATVALLAVGSGFALTGLVGFQRPGLLAVLIATSSGAVVLPVIQDLPRRPPALVSVIAWVAIADVGTVLALPLILANGSLWRVLLGAALVLGSGVVLYVAARWGARLEPMRQLRHLSHARGWGLDLRLSLLALFAAAWLATHFGASLLIAGFTVGAVVASVGEPRRVADQLIGVGEGFAIPVFFVHLGAQLDVGALVSSGSAIRLAVGIAAASTACHLAAALLWRMPVGSGLLATAQLGVPAAVASIGLDTHQVSPAQAAAIMTAALLSLLVCSVGAARLGHSGRLPDLAAPPNA